MSSKARPFPQITTSAQVKREMVWQALRQHGDHGATPAELAADLIKGAKATGQVDECAALLLSPLNELVVGLRAKRIGERFVARNEQAAT